MAKNNQSTSSANQNILLGILAGTIVGAIAAAVVNSSKGKEIREDLFDAYNDASKKVSSAAQHISEKSHELSDRFLHRNHNMPEKNLNLTIGAIAGGILGISAIVFLSSDSAKGLREQVVHSFECLSDKAHELEDRAHSTAESLENNISSWVKKVDKLINTFQEKNFNYSKKSASHSDNQPLDKILDWAVAAAQLFQSLKK